MRPWTTSKKSEVQGYVKDQLREASPTATSDEFTDDVPLTNSLGVRGSRRGVYTLRCAALAVT